MDFLSEADKKVNQDYGSNNQEEVIDKEYVDEGKVDLGEIGQSSDQPMDQVNLASFVRNKFQECRNQGSRVALEGQWMTNYAYLLGFDSVFYDTNAKQFRPTGRLGMGLRSGKIHINKVLPTCQRRQARMCKNAPRFEVRPDDNSQEAKDRARLEQELAYYYYEKEQVQLKRIQTNIGLQQCGNYFAGVTWNPNRGEWVTCRDPKTGEIKREREGEPEIEFIHPLEMFNDPLGTTIETCQWLGRAKIRKLEYFRERYPERGHLIVEENTWLISLQYEMRLQTLVGQGPAQTGIQMQMQNSAIELTYYERPSKAFPEGRQIVVANNIVLEVKPLPIGQIPIVKFDDIPIPGRFFAEAIVTHLRPIQDQFNTMMTKRSRWVNLMLTGKYLSAVGHELMQESLDNDSGEVVEYTPIPGVPAPTVMQVAQMPSYIYKEEESLNNQFYDISGEGDISRGQLPSAGIPAIGMQILLEQDVTRISIVTDQHEIEIAKLMKYTLMFAEKYITNKRLLKKSDPNGGYIINEFSGSDLKTKHDITVIKGSLAPVSKASKRNDLINAFDKGFLGDVNDPMVRMGVFSELEFGSVDTYWKRIALIKAQIQRDIKMIEKELIPPVHELDNHDMHLVEKNDYRLSDKYQTLSVEAKAIFDNNVEEHLRWKMKLMLGAQGMGSNENIEQIDQMISEKENTEMQAQAQAADDYESMTGQPAPQLPPQEM